MLKIRTARPDIRVALSDGASIIFRSDKPSAGLVAARRAAGLVIEAGGDDADATVAFTVALAKWGAWSWEGVGDEDGQPLELTPDNLELLMTEMPDAYRRIDQGFVIEILNRDAEKNGSAPSPVGGTPAGARTAKSKKPGAVGTSARPAKASAKSVPTSKTPASPKKARPSGKRSSAASASSVAT
jgi:hypothetical protein